MRNADYWRQRARINSDAAHADANEYIARLEEIYRDAVMSVQADIDRWYGRFADNNQITLAEARKWLTEGELEEFHWSVDKYIKAAEEHGLDPAWQKKLENASARYHISRLEAIQMQIQQQAELVYGNQMDGLDELLRRIADNGYNHAAFDAMKGLGMGWDFTKLDQKALDAMLKKPWTSDGKTFTDRCWEGKADLIDGIQRELVQSLMRGDSLVKTRDRIAQRFGVSKYKAGRLAHTEATYFNAISAKACYDDLGVEKIEIQETLDKHTCEICAAMDGKVIDKKDYQPGVTVPPFHPNCRGDTVPWFDDMADVGARFARGENGKAYYVPPNITYAQWKQAYVDGWDKKKYPLVVTDTPKQPSKISGQHKDVTQEWLDSATPNSHEVTDVKVFEQDGMRFAVHGTEVVLDYSVHEKEIADLLESILGGELRMMPKVNSPQGISTPDYIFRGERCDLKTLKEGAKENTIYNRIKKANRQARILVLDVSLSGLSNSVIDSQISKIFWSEETKFVDTIIVIKGDKIYRIVKRQ